MHRVVSPDRAYVMQIDNCLLEFVLLFLLGVFLFGMPLIMGSICAVICLHVVCGVMVTFNRLPSC